MDKYEVGDWVETVNIQDQDEDCHNGMVGFIDEVSENNDYKYHVVINGKYGTFLESELKLKDVDIYKNMKIEVNDEQSFNEIAAELERIGYKSSTQHEDSNNFINALSNGYFIATVIGIDKFREPTTLAELKEM